jgi:hypothetical protein
MGEPPQAAMVGTVTGPVWYDSGLEVSKMEDGKYAWLPAGSKYVLSGAPIWKDVCTTGPVPHVTSHVNTTSATVMYKSSWGPGIVKMNL